MDKATRLHKIITERKKQYRLRQDYMARKEKELKDNYTKGRISKETFELGSSQLKGMKEQTRRDYEEIPGLEKEMKDAL